MCGEVARLPPLDPPLPRREGQERIDEAVGPHLEGEHLPAGRAQGRGVGLRIRERHLDQDPLGRERGSQFVRRVGHEVPLRLERRRQPGEQVVQRLSEPGEFVVAAT